MISSLKKIQLNLARPANHEWLAAVRIVTKIHKIFTKSLQMKSRQYDAIHRQDIYFTRQWLTVDFRENNTNFNSSHSFTKRQHN